MHFVNVHVRQNGVDFEIFEPLPPHFDLHAGAVSDQRNDMAINPEINSHRTQVHSLYLNFPVEAVNDARNNLAINSENNSGRTQVDSIPIQTSIMAPIDSF